MPSHLARFAAHVDAISSALDEARENLEQCVKALRDTSPATQITPVPPPLEEEPQAALQAYERLRRELGLALRECERGRRPS